MRKKISSLFFASVLTLGIPANMTLAKGDPEPNPDPDQDPISSPVNYVALGDSLPAGMTPVGEIDKSYVDFIADHFEMDVTKEFAVPGYKSEHLLEDIATNKTIGDDSIQDVISEADVLTLTIGANDLLEEVTTNPDGTIDLDPESVPAIMGQVQENLSAILMEISQLNSSVEVYVSGYHFPYPYLPLEQQAELEVVLSMLNETIQGVSVGLGASFVPLDTAFGEEPTTFLPNPENIHPSVEGYEKFAEQFIQVMDVGSTSTEAGAYTVKSGDTLSALALTFNTTVAKLVSLNGILDPDLIYVDEAFQTK